MTYIEQLKVEEKNKQILQEITSTVTPDEFINFYRAHTQAETLAYYKIRTIKQLIKILKIFNYDFSIPKPSKFKGKKAARSHESYLLGGKKSASTQKQNWKNKTDQELKEWSDKQSKAHLTEHYKQVKSAQNLKKWFNRTDEERLVINQKRSATMKQHVQALSPDAFRQWISHKYKCYKLNNIYFDSFPELCFYLFNISNGINIIRAADRLEYTFGTELHYYFPDFKIDNDYIEIKGEHLYESMLVPGTLDNAKYNCMLKNNVKIITTKDYQKYIDWFYAQGYKKEDFLTDEGEIPE